MKLSRAIPLIVGVGLLALLVAGLVVLNSRWNAYKQAEAAELGRRELYHLLDGMKVDGLTVVHAEEESVWRYLHVRLPASDVPAFKQRIIDSFTAPGRRYQNVSVAEFPFGQSLVVIDAPPWWHEAPDSKRVVLIAKGVLLVVVVPASGGDVMIYRGVMKD